MDNIHFTYIALCTPGAVCSKLTTSLVNVSLEFKTLILQTHCYFLLEKCENLCNAKDSHIFPTKNNSVFDNVVGIYLTRCPLNDVVRLTVL